MSAIHISLILTYQDDELAKLVFEAFSQWPTASVRKKKPDAKRMKAIKCSMDWIGYEIPHLYKRVFEQEVCLLESAPRKQQNNVFLHFYCGKRAGWQFWDEVFDDLGTLPVTIKGYFMYDMTGQEQFREETYPKPNGRK
ncbi:hypothetical protein [Glaciecola sp. 1036]|uniref:hypothetical protein n=1 Tax=Alteromonadaceae TaxID=72275 RepID=UPI003D034C96